MIDLITKDLSAYLKDALEFVLWRSPSKGVDYNVVGWQLIYEPKLFYDDPIYVRLSDALKTKLNLHGQSIHLDIDRDVFRGAKDGSLYLLTINDDLVLTHLHYTFSGLDGGGVWYTLDLLNFERTADK